MTSLSQCPIPPVLILIICYQLRHPASPTLSLHLNSHPMANHVFSTLLFILTDGSVGSMDALTQNLSFFVAALSPKVRKTWHHYVHSVFCCTLKNRASIGFKLQSPCRLIVSFMQIAELSQSSDHYRPLSGQSVSPSVCKQGCAFIIPFFHMVLHFIIKLASSLGKRMTPFCSSQAVKPHAIVTPQHI